MSIERSEEQFHKKLNSMLSEIADLKRKYRELATSINAGEVTTVVQTSGGVSSHDALSDVSTDDHHTKTVSSEIDHDATTNFVAAEHVSLPNTTANVLSDLLDEDDMASNSATQPASQQSIKAYVDSRVREVEFKFIKGGTYGVYSAVTATHAEAYKGSGVIFQNSSTGGSTSDFGQWHVRVPKTGWDDSATYKIVALVYSYSTPTNWEFDVYASAFADGETKSSNNLSNGGAYAPDLDVGYRLKETNILTGKDINAGDMVELRLKVSTVGSEWIIFASIWIEKE